jgi:ABC-type antimicrobial peptide transport system permease subunit
MSSLDFALKDFYRKRRSNYPFLLIITLIVAFTEFLIYFASSLGLNIFIKTTFENKYYFTGEINLIYEQFNNLIQILLIILSVGLVITVTTTLVISKKRDIAIMKSIGTLPRKLYSFYLLETYILFFIGFLFGIVLGLISFGIFALIMSFFNFPIKFQLDLIYTPILFFSSIISIFFITGNVLRKIGKQKIISSFSKDIPYNYNARKKIKFIPKWLTSMGYNIKMAVVNTLRKKGEFKRYLILFSIIGILIFTLGLGTIVLNNSSQEWIHKSQSEDIIMIGHKDVIYNYSLMYRMFSNPTIFVDENEINFLKPDYFFNLSDIDELNDFEEIQQLDERIVSFFDVKELTGTHIYEDGSYIIVGQDREDNIPIIGVNPDNLIQNFEIQGRFFTHDEQDAFENMTIGDSLAHNFFDYPLDQRLELTDFGRQFYISGVVIDSFFSGYAGYISINESRKILNLTIEEVNLVSLKIKSDTFETVKEDLNSITSNIGDNFSYLRLDEVFQDNLNYLNNLSLYPMFLVILISLLAILSLYTYQKAGIMEKAKDFLIMRAIGSKSSSLKKILYLESMFVLIPSLLLSLGIGMIINSLFLLQRVYLPPLYVPFTLFTFLFALFMIFNLLSLIPIMKKINNFSIKDFNMY